VPDPDAAPAFGEPLDEQDPRFDRGAEPQGGPPRRLVPGRGPLPDMDNPRIRAIRVALPVLFFSALAVVAWVFFAGLRPGPQSAVIGPEPAVRAAVAERPKRVCFHDNNPCAWLTVVGDRLTAFNTSGPLPQEYGRAGVGWCPTSGWYGANATGSRFDQEGRVARGPAPRGLDRYALRVDARGMVHISFTELITGRLAGLAGDVRAPDGPHCEVIAFDRDADLPALEP
jgi:hypothetical protein